MLLDTCEISKQVFWNKSEVILYWLIFFRYFEYIQTKYQTNMQNSEGDQAVKQDGWHKS